MESIQILSIILITVVFLVGVIITFRDDNGGKGEK